MSRTPGIKDIVLRTFSGWEFLPFEMTILKSAGSIMSNFRVYSLAVGMLLAFGMSLFAGSLAWAQQPAEERSVLKKLQQLKENDRIDELPLPARRQLTGDGQRTGQKQRVSTLNKASAPKDLSDYKTRDPVQSWTMANNPEPQLNFALTGTPQRAGDVNGDGIDDYVYTATPRDERTPSNLEDRTSRLLHIGI